MDQAFQSIKAKWADSAVLLFDQILMHEEIAMEKESNTLLAQRMLEKDQVADAVQMTAGKGCKHLWKSLTKYNKAEEKICALADKFGGNAIAFVVEMCQAPELQEMLVRVRQAAAILLVLRACYRPPKAGETRLVMAEAASHELEQLQVMPEALGPILSKTLAAQMASSDQ